MEAHDITDRLLNPNEQPELEAMKTSDITEAWEWYRKSHSEEAAAEFDYWLCDHYAQIKLAENKANDFAYACPENDGFKVLARMIRKL